MRWFLLLLAVTMTACATSQSRMDQAARCRAANNCLCAGINWGQEAKAGNPAAQNNMGTIWETGCPVPEVPTISIPQNYVEAYNWYMLAATNGEPAAVFNLGRYHENGFGVEKDLEKAVSWYSLAARKGQEQARTRLVELGRPVPPPDLVNVVISQQPSSRPSMWRELGEWFVAFAGVYAVGAAAEYQRPAVPTNVNVDVRANCRTRVIGDVIKTDCY